MTGETVTFAQAIGIDYSGAETANSSLKGLRVYMADVGRVPREVAPPPSPKRYRTRRGIAEWLCKGVVVQSALIMQSRVDRRGAGKAAWSARMGRGD